MNRSPVRAHATGLAILATTAFAPTTPPADYAWSRVVAEAPYAGSYNYPAFVVGNEAWLLHPEGAWRTTDGTRFTPTRLPKSGLNSAYQRYVFHDNSVIALGALTGNYERFTITPRILRTRHFTRWDTISTNANIPQRVFYAAQSFNGTLMLIGGYDGRAYHNDVWTSADGARWTRILEHAPWSPRNAGATVVFQGRLWMIGGGVIDGQTNPNPTSEREVWSTADGRSWTRHPDRAGSEFGGTPIVFDGKVWFVGANRAGTFAPAVLVTSDFRTWESQRAPWPARGAPAVWVMRNALYMTGGKFSEGSGENIRFAYRNDVWKMEAQARDSIPAERLAAREWFRDAKLGMFIHWGVYSQLGQGEWVMNNINLTVPTYEWLASAFNPVKFDAREWVAIAKAAGARYITITSRHHDGFSMFASRVSRYNIVDWTPFKRDPLAELAEECRKENIKLFFYYSQLDWHHPDYFPRGRTGRNTGRAESGEWTRYLDFMDAQLEELLTRYGPLGGIWFDGMWDKPQADWRLDRTYALIHRLQPAALIVPNHHETPRPGEDAQTFEQDLPGANTAGFNTQHISALPLETSLTMNTSWGFNITDRRWKSTREIVHYLVRASGAGANLLLNIGPRPDGTIQPEATQRLRELGDWLRTHGTSVYGTRATMMGANTAVPFTQGTDGVTLTLPATLPVATAHATAAEPASALSYDRIVALVLAR